MKEIYKNLYVGSLSDCSNEIKDGWVVIHACKSPCHQNAVKYRGNLLKTHPNYLIKEQEPHLFLNMVDMNVPLDHLYTGPIINATMNFIQKNIQTKKVLIHCNQGLSRSPALALVYLAKVAKVINNQNYEMAKTDFIRIFPNYQPGSGLEYYLIHSWNQF